MLILCRGEPRVQDFTTVMRSFCKEEEKDNLQKQKTLKKTKTPIDKEIVL